MGAIGSLGEDLGVVVEDDQPVFALSCWEWFNRCPQLAVGKSQAWDSLADSDRGDDRSAAGIDP